ncbi:MAG: hypothetical protein ACK4MQ_00700 [Hyphomonas sp.]
MTESPGFEGDMVLAAPLNPGAPEGVGPLTAKFVRYPGSQQLILWLPQDGFSGYETLEILGPGEGVAERAAVTDRLNGRVQILIDTYPWPPGSYRIEITHQAGWSHALSLEKQEARAARPPEPAPEPASAPEPSSGPIVYRDGFGNILPDTDLEMRAAAAERIAARFSRRLEFEGTYRAGTIIYVEGDIRLRFDHEMCGGRVYFSIDIPAPKDWEALTGRPLAERSDIVAFVAEETRRRQASRWNYVIHDDRIDFVD